ncbi:DNA mismatch repair protein MutT [Candidatus Woesebacteria bacterium RIFCSPLOWO2_01_FULL_37_19]|uniref:DNA mismatch repair protein MutT n=2 Tax=Candidatus Woeseibacteriota TaxID=1752722 RepID=A0A1F8B5C5_9BACT|nr:MAG: DNA mismatch repair protein MutT [Candidatus Woesebacteria bacterium RIFCSPLOWO2_01_FULL_37_19]
MGKVPRVGIGVIILKSKKVLLLKRKNAHGSGSWAFVGGHLEYGETPEEGASREVSEEIGLNIKNPKAVAFTNDFFPKEKKHYITIFVVTKYDGSKFTINEPDKIEAVEWFEWGKFPNPLFTPVANLIKKGFNPLKIKL